jgi:hypothetical protein
MDKCLKYFQEKNIRIRLSGNSSHEGYVANLHNYKREKISPRYVQGQRKSSLCFNAFYKATSLAGVLFLIGVPVWASYQPVSGSSVTVAPQGGSTWPISIQNPTTNIVSTNTLVIQQVGQNTVTPGSGTFQTSGTGTYAVVPASGTFSVLQVGQNTVTPGSGTFNTSLVSGNTMYILTGSSMSVAVGYFVGAGSVPVSVQNTLTVNTHAVTGNGTFAVTSSTGIFATSGTGTYAVVPASGTFPVQTIGTVAVTPSSGTYPVSGVGTFAVTPSSGTYPVSAVGQLTVTPGSGTFTTTFGGLAQNIVSTQPFTVILTTAGVNASTVTIQAPNNNTTPIPVSGIAANITAGNGLNVVLSSSTYGTTVTGVLTTTNTVVVSSAVAGYSNVTFVINPGTSTINNPGETLVFEQSFDNGTTWIQASAAQAGAEVFSSSYVVIAATTAWIADTLGATNFRVRVGQWYLGNSAVTLIPTNMPDSRTVSSVLAVQTMVNGLATPTSVGYQAGGASVPVNAAGGYAENGTSTGSFSVPTLPGYYTSSYRGGVAATNGRTAAFAILAKSGLAAFAQLPDITLNGYSASTSPYSITYSTQDFTGLCANSGVTTLVTGLRVACTQTTAGIIPIAVAKRSSKYTLLFSTITAVPQDSSYAVVQSTAIFSSGANLTNGTLVGYVDNSQFGCMAAGTASPNDIYISPSSWKNKPIVLRSGECLGANFQGTAVSGIKVTPAWEWIEVVTP